MRLEHYKSKYWRPTAFLKDTPFTPEQGLDRVHYLCACEGKYDCDCVGTVNLAHQQLWDEHNIKQATG